MDKPMPMDKKIRRLCLHVIAFNTKTGILHKSKCIISPDASYGAKWNHLCMNLKDSSDWDFISM